jgi:uncharacterized coiled-coil protein SlyX
MKGNQIMKSQNNPACNALALRAGIIKTILLALGFVALSPETRAVNPPPDGGYAGGNTAEGQAALLSLSTGGFNTAVGYLSLRSDASGSFNTGVGAGALLANTGDQNTATGAGALLSNTTGGGNTANGTLALFNNTAGNNNTATGADALLFNTGSANTGSGNTANGAGALINNTIGNNNTGTGFGTLTDNTSGNGNTAIGRGALAATTGDGNTALGANAGNALTTGVNNIDIGLNVIGTAGDTDTIRIGNPNITRTFITGISGNIATGGATVYVESNGHLGTLTSSVRLKDEIKPMGKASEAILALRPVSFRYKKEIDPRRVAQFGLIAEEVERVNPDLIIRDAEGKPQTVRYEQINAMLLNEFLKEHRKVEEQARKMDAQEHRIGKQEATVAELKSTVAQQQSAIAILTAQFKEQTAQIQRASADVELNRRMPQIVLSNR